MVAPLRNDAQTTSDSMSTQYFDVVEGPDW